jgi:hypothetical protein
MPAPKVTVKGPTRITDIHNPVQQKHGKKARLLHSNFHIVINSNKPFNPGSRELELISQKLKEVTDSWWNDDEIEKYLIFRKEGHFYDDEFIEELTMLEPALERGPRMNYPHVQCAIMIAHRSNLQIDCVKIADLYTEQCKEFLNEGDRFYCRSTFHRKQFSFEEVIQNYLAKNFREEPAANKRKHGETENSEESVAEDNGGKRRRVAVRKPTR